MAPICTCGHPAHPGIRCDCGCTDYRAVSAAIVAKASDCSDCVVASNQDGPHSVCGLCGGTFCWKHGHPVMHTCLWVAVPAGHPAAAGKP